MLWVSFPVPGKAAGRSRCRLEARLRRGSSSRAVPAATHP